MSVDLTYEKSYIYKDEFVFTNGKSEAIGSRRLLKYTMLCTPYTFSMECIVRTRMLAYIPACTFSIYSSVLAMLCRCS